MRQALTVLVVAWASTTAAWNTWCGLHYEIGSPSTIPPPPWSNTPPPPTVTWSIRPRLSIYTYETRGSFLITPPEFLMDEDGVTRFLFEATVLKDEGGGDERVIGVETLPKARTEAYRVKASLRVIGEEEKKVETVVELWRLLEPEVGFIGSVVKYGHYTSWGDFLERNFTILDDIKREGYTVVHPVPPFDDSLDLMDAFLDYADKVKRFRSKPSVIGYYTADEPDGTSDPPTLSHTAYNTIRALDPYKPVALVLNCRDHGLERYADGADIVMTDAYMVDVNLTFSAVWGTPCNATSVRDIYERVVEYEGRLGKVGKKKPIWAVLQGYPNPDELRAMVYMSLIARATGILFWLRSRHTPHLFLLPLSTLGKEISYLSTTLLHPSAHHHPSPTSPIPTASWTLGNHVTVLIATSARVESRPLEVPALKGFYGVGRVLFGGTGRVEVVDGWIRIEKVEGLMGMAVEVVWNDDRRGFEKQEL
ncbi:hypothetical protein BC829DRAFT_443066 [Chytridium lagenaria]|nr:hypothetical protein BC829DRAFT_443066 [Chytridium lagenaria]